MFVATHNTVKEIDMNNPLHRQWFDTMYGFHESSLEDIPVTRGVRVFDHKGHTIVVADDIMALAAELECQTQQLLGR